MAILSFIHHSNTKDIIHHLETAWTADPKDRRIIPILGYEGTGKKRLIEHWITEHRKAGSSATHAPIVWAQARESEKTRPKRSTYTTAVTYTLFSEIVFALGEVTEQLGKKQSYNRWFMPTGRQYTDSQFNSLYNFVRTEFKNLGARALVISEAQHLDTKAFKMLRLWYDYRKHQFVLVLCFKKEKQAKPAEALRELYQAIPPALLYDPIELSHVSRESFVTDVTPDILKALQVSIPESVAEQLDIAKRYWRKTEGDWHAIELRAQDLKLALIKNGDPSRKLTPKLLDEVFGT